MVPAILLAPRMVMIDILVMLHMLIMVDTSYEFNKYVVKMRVQITSARF